MCSAAEDGVDENEERIGTVLFRRAMEGKSLSPVETVRLQEVCSESPPGKGVEEEASVPQAV